MFKYRYLTMAYLPTIIVICKNSRVSVFGGIRHWTAIKISNKINNFMEHITTKRALIVIVGLILLVSKPTLFIFYILVVSAVWFYKKYGNNSQVIGKTLQRKATEKELERMKVRCPLCKDTVPANALKCSHCAGDLTEAGIKAKIEEQVVAIQKRGKIVAVAIFAFIVAISVVLISGDSGAQPNTAATQVTNTAPVVTLEDKAAAQKKLDDILDLAKKAGLVTSYEFSETARVVYVGRVWYTQTVAFKKDFLGSIALPLKTVTGYHRFEVLDAYSNEKVAEVTAFSGSIEVYK